MLSLRYWCALAVQLGCGLLVGCGGGLDSPSDYPDYEGDVDDHLLTPENEGNPSVSLGSFVVREELCDKLNTRVELRQISEDDFGRHLEKIGIPPVQIKARGNLFWYDFSGTDPDDGDLVRLRVAVLADANEAADELHKSLLQHGPGWWGFRRSNLSVLAPKASTGEMVDFALMYKIPCWAMISMADLDDVRVVPGPYMEF